MFGKIRSELEKYKIIRIILYLLRQTGMIGILHYFQDKKRQRMLGKGTNPFLEFCDNHKKELENVSNLLEDKRSKEVLKSLLQYRKSYDRKYLKGIIDKNQYFDEKVISFSPYEIMVDCGAYIGDTIEAFVKKTVGYQHIYAFEPDKKIINNLKKNIRLSPDKYTVFSVGAWSEKETLHFSAKGTGGGNINRDGEGKIEVDSIDNLLIDIPVSFIKMDIEGAEMEALKGAKK